MVQYTGSSASRRGGAKPSEDVDEAELHLTEADFNVDANVFEDLGPELLGLVRSLSNRALRAASPPSATRT